MPKILIREQDFTNPGAFSEYANYSVLLTGFTGVKKPGTGKVITPDTYDVYEFKSAGDFAATIGVVQVDGNEVDGVAVPAKHVDVDTGIAVYHYGNQMAYKLLQLGYTVIYKPIYSVLPTEDKSKPCFFDIFENTFWQPFKDRASYDFRFISHGLLESSEYPNGYYNALKNLSQANESLAALAPAITELGTIEEAANIAAGNNADFDKALFCENYYAYGPTYAQSQNDADKIDQYYKQNQNNLFKIEDSDSYYASFSEAQTNINNQEKSLNDEKDAYQLTIDTYENYLVNTAKINTANNCIVNLAKYIDDEPISRGDCVALIELDENTYKDAIINPENHIMNAINSCDSLLIDRTNGQYCALTVPSVVYKGSTKGIKMPAAFHYLACFIYSLQAGYREWYAAAGYSRGISSLTIDHTTVTLGEIAINALEPRCNEDSKEELKFACNVIANFRGSYYLWGNRTAFPIGGANDSKYHDLTASSFLNIRHLCTTLKKQLYVACRRFTFDPNSDTLWFNFVNAIKPTLETMKADQGIRDYKVIKVIEENPQKATLKAKIRIIPIEAVEDFDLTISLEDSFGETTVSTSESI